MLHVGTGLTSNSRRGFPGATAVKNLPATQEMQVRPLGGEDPPEKEMATHPSILAWEIPWSGDPGGLQSMGLQDLDMIWQQQLLGTPMSLFNQPGYEM